jgi:hypothetical protein
MDVQINAEDIRLNSTDDIRLNATGDVVIGSTTGHIRFEDGPVHIGFPVTTENEVATKEYVTGAISDIDLTFTSDEITEGSTNLYHTDTRAKDAVAAALGDGIEYVDGSFDVQFSNGITIGGGSGNELVIDRNEVDNWYEASGAVSTHNDLTTGVHGVTGDVVGTTDTQDLSNKRIIDTLYFTDGVTIANEGEIAVRAVSHDFDVQANYGDLNLKTVAEPEGVGSNVNISSLYGDIVLDTPGQDKHAYIGSVAPANQIATRADIDATTQGLTVEAPVRTASTANITLSGEGTLEDGQSYWSTDRVLVRAQTTASDNGLYIVNKNGAWEKASDDSTTVSGSFVFVAEGASAGKGYVKVGNAWNQFSETGNYITSVSAELDVTGGNLSVVANTFDAYGSAAAITPTSLGLGNVDNTSDANKPVSTDTQAALDLKANASNPTISGGLTVDGSGDFTIDADAGIILQAGTTSYLNSATAGNEIATEGYVDDAIAGVTVDYAAMAGTYIDWTGTQFEVDASDLITGEGLATTTDVSTALLDYTLTSSLDSEVGSFGYLKSADLPTMYTDEDAVSALEAVVPNFTAVEINSVAKQIAATVSAPTALSQVTAYEFLGTEYRSAKFLVKTAYGAHTELSEVLITLDSSNNIAITEYAIVGTNGSSSTITADYVEVGTTVRLRVTPTNNTSTITVVGTLLA